MRNLSPIILSTITLIDDIERKYHEMLHGDDENQRELDENSLHDLLEDLFKKNEELRSIHRGRRTIRRDTGSKKKKKSIKKKRSLRMKKK